MPNSKKEMRLFRDIFPETKFSLVEKGPAVLKKLSKRNSRRELRLNACYISGPSAGHRTRISDNTPVFVKASEEKRIEDMIVNRLNSPHLRRVHA